MQQIGSYQAPSFVDTHPAIMKAETLASTGAEEDHVSGTVFGKITATKKFVQISPAANDGSEVAAAILVEDVTVPAAGDLRTNLYKHGAFKSKGLVWPDGITAEQKTTAIEQLDAAGLIIK